MLVIAFDMTVAEIRGHYPKGVSAAYGDTARTLAPFGFEWVQGSVYICKSGDFGPLLAAIDALRAKPWFRASVRGIRAFRVENCSYVTGQIRARGKAVVWH